MDELGEEQRGRRRKLESDMSELTNCFVLLFFVLMIGIPLSLVGYVVGPVLCFLLAGLLTAGLVALAVFLFVVDRCLLLRVFLRVVIVCLALLLLWFILSALGRAREKPVIYLYPETEQVVNVRLHYDGALRHTYPAYGEDGWSVVAKPSGELIDLRTGRSHYCLFWEGEDAHPYELDEGFVVKGEETVAFLESALAQLGLNEREANEFIIYWLPRMEKNPYNLIHFATTEYARQVPLEITPPPDIMIRVLMVFKPLTRPADVRPQHLIPVERRGFTVVEWGGTEQ